MVPSHLKALPSAKELWVEWAHWGTRIFSLSLAHKIAACLCLRRGGKTARRGKIKQKHFVLSVRALSSVRELSNLMRLSPLWSCWFLAFFSIIIIKIQEIQWKGEDTPELILSGTNVASFKLDLTGFFIQIGANYRRIRPRAWHFTTL